MVAHSHILVFHCSSHACYISFDKARGVLKWKYLLFRLFWILSFILMLQFILRIILQLSSNNKITAWYLLKQFWSIVWHAETTYFMGFVYADLRELHFVCTPNVIVSFQISHYIFPYHTKCKFYFSFTSIFYLSYDMTLMVVQFVFKNMKVISEGMDDEARLFISYFINFKVGV